MSAFSANGVRTEETTPDDSRSPSVVNFNVLNSNGNIQPKRRKRVAKACDACSKRKIQCDAEFPQCNWCKHHDMLCTFDRITNRSRKKVTRVQETPTATTESSEGCETARLLDQEYIKQKCAQRASRPPPFPSIQGHAFGILHFAGCHLGQVSSSRGIPLISVDGQRWVERVTGETVDVDRLYGRYASLENGPHTYDHLPQRNLVTKMPVTQTGLPPRYVADQCLDSFAMSVRRLVFPLVDPILFRRTISLAYDDETYKTSEFECTTARAAVFIFIAFADVLLAGGVSHLNIDRGYCANEALKLLPYATLSSNLDGLQTLLGFSLFALIRGDPETASIHMSSAAGAVIRLGGHIYTKDSEDSLLISGNPSAGSSSSIAARVARHTRNLFWLTFTADFMVSLHSGMPPSFDIAFCDLTLPPKYEEMYAQQAIYGIHATLPEGTDFDPWFPGDIRLTIIQAKAHVKLYSHYAMSKSDAELLRDIRELDMEVDAWRESVPPLFRPSWVHSQHLPTSGYLNIVILRLLFYHIIALIHRASSRCQAWLNMQPRWDFDALGSSLALCVEASRSSLLYMSNVADKVSNSFFSMILIFPMTSFLVLFCNLLLDPLDVQAVSDLELLNQVPDTIRRLKLRNLSLRETSHMELVYEFVRELARLGQCAVTKARRERGLESEGRP